jgi:hypothetical protein
LRKADTVLPQVLGSFLFVPLEFRAHSSKIREFRSSVEI